MPDAPRPADDRPDAAAGPASRAPAAAPVEPGPSAPTAAGDRAALDTFLARHGPLDVDWTGGRLRWLRWACAAGAALILLGFTQFADVGLAVRFAETGVALALLGLFVWLGQAMPKGGGLRVDEGGLRILPDGPLVAPGDIEAIEVDGGGRVLRIRTRTPHDYGIPLRARLRGHDGRLRLPPGLVAR